MKISNKVPKVVVLISTFNGEKYLKEQLDSILDQTYSNIEILLRDDESKDDTMKILKQYEIDKRIELIKGKNIGFVESFLELLKNAPIADYYAFSDQDDIWEKNKIERAVDLLEKEENKDIPIMYYSNYDFYTQDMEFSSHPKQRSKISFNNSLLECVNAGMATLINNELREKIIAKENPRYSLGHDWLFYMVASSYGKVIYDDKAMVRHRIHTSNTSKCGESFFVKLKRRVTTFRKNDHFQKLQKQIQEFDKIYGDGLRSEQKAFIELFASPISLKKQMKKLFYPKRLMNILSEEIILRIAVIFGMI